MIIHPPAYNIALRPYYYWMTNGQQINRADNMAAAYLLDYVENADPLSPDNDWKPLPMRQLYDALSPFVAQLPVRNALQWLEADGLIECRFDPSKPTHRTKQYRLKETEVQRRIDCWSAGEAVKYAQPRIIQTVTLNQVETPQIMQRSAEYWESKIRMRVIDDLNSNTPIQQDIKGSNHYESTMATLHVLLGVEVFPVVGKKPAPKTPDDAFGWEWSKKRLGRPGRQLATVHAWKVATGYGMIPVKSDRLVFLDVDQPKFDHELVERLPRLKETYKQTRGDHCCYAFRLPYVLESRFEIDDANGEVASLRNHNSYQVGAGSLHPSGERYEVANLVPPIELTDAEAQTLIAMFQPAAPKKPAYNHPTMQLRQPDPVAANASLRKWARNGQQAALRELSAANKGAFNKTLYKTACRVANLAKVTGESREQLHDLLWEVCEQAGYVRRDGSSQTWATIRSGINAGEQMPLNIPDKTRAS